MKNFLFFCFLLPFMAISSQASAQDYKYDTPQCLIDSTYSLMTFSKGTEPDWNAIRLLFHDKACIVLSKGNAGLDILTRDEFILRWKNDFEKYNLLQTGIIEKKLFDTTQITGNIATSSVIYELSIPNTSYPAKKGLDCFHLIKENNRWYIISVVNEAFREGVEAPYSLKKDFQKY